MSRRCFSDLGVLEMDGLDGFVCVVMMGWDGDRVCRDNLVRMEGKGGVMGRTGPFSRRASKSNPTTRKSKTARDLICDTKCMGINLNSMHDILILPPTTTPTTLTSSPPPPSPPTSQPHQSTSSQTLPPQTPSPSPAPASSSPAGPPHPCPKPGRSIPRTLLPYSL